MSSRFKVTVTGHELDRAQAILNRAGIPTLGPTLTWLEGSGATVGHEMAAVLDAETAEAAGARVKEVLSEDGWDVEAAGLRG